MGEESLDVFPCSIKATSQSNTTFLRQRRRLVPLLKAANIQACTSYIPPQSQF